MKAIWRPHFTTRPTPRIFPGAPGKLRGIGKVAKWGRTIAFTEGELYDPEGRLLAKATGTALPTPFQTYKS